MTNALLMSRGESAEFLHQWVLGVLSELPSQKPSASLRDLGCGTGTFLGALGQGGYTDLMGCDGHEFKGTSRFKFVKADLNAKLPFKDAQFAIVTAIEVIEHLENPRHLVREIFRILKPGGLAIITTPNTESITSLLSLGLRGFHSAFSDADYPAHITPVLAVDLRRIFQESLFENIQLKWSDQGRVPGVGWHWQQASRALFRGKRFSDQLLLKALKKAHA